MPNTDPTTLDLDTPAADRGIAPDVAPADVGWFGRLHVAARVLIVIGGLLVVAAVTVLVMWLVLATMLQDGFM